MFDAKTIKELKESGWEPVTVKEEMRRNLIKKVRNGDQLFPGIVGYDETVIPQIENAILSKHDMLFLGLRGQAKTRMLRAMTDFLDEKIPVIKECEVNDNPFNPICKSCNDLIAEHGDYTEIAWLPRDHRYREKLATPDVTIADLIGEVDLIKVAEGRYLSSELTMHFGLIPRTNRGIFAINELPDLAPKIQVGLFNLLEERDIQIRGYPIRIPLDIMVVFSANPEDYTNRGRIVTPLKDRIGSVVATHYPLTRDDGIEITEENAWAERDGGHNITVPKYMKEIIEEIAILARSSGEINQQSGVSARMSICNYENMISNVERRLIKLGESEGVPRISDLRHTLASSRGKIELEISVEENEQDTVIQKLAKDAARNVFAHYLDVDAHERDVMALSQRRIVVGDDMPSRTYVEYVDSMKELRRLVQHLAKNIPDIQKGQATPAMLASMVEFILEGLHVNRRLNKDEVGGTATYRRGRRLL